jgi:hypothetical protein
MIQNSDANWTYHSTKTKYTKKIDVGSNTEPWMIKEGLPCNTMQLLSLEKAKS